jgi:CBS domain-containing protein
MRTVKDILDHKEKVVNIIQPNAMVIDALKNLIEQNISYLIVEENGEYKGIFSERDYTRKLVLEGRSSRETMVEQVMTTNLPEVSLSTSVEDCMYRMNRKGSRYLAVFTGAHFEGIVTINDLLREALTSKEKVFSTNLTNSLLDTSESSKVF